MFLEVWEMKRSPYVVVLGFFLLSVCMSGAHGHEHVCVNRAYDNN